jgi:hypothetical protein
MFVSKQIHNLYLGKSIVYNFNKSAQNTPSPTGRKFAQPGHPGFQQGLRKLRLCNDVSRPLNSFLSIEGVRSCKTN